MDRCSSAKLLVLAAEVGVRWNETAELLVEQLAELRASQCPLLLRGATKRAWQDRWWSLLGTAVQGAVAASLLARSGPQLVLDTPAAFPPDLEDLLDAQRWA